MTPKNAGLLSRYVQHVLVKPKRKRPQHNLVLEFWGICAGYVLDEVASNNKHNFLDVYVNPTTGLDHWFKVSYSAQAQIHGLSFMPLVFQVSNQTHRSLQKNDHVFLVVPISSIPT